MWGPESQSVDSETNSAKGIEKDTEQALSE